MTEPDDTEAVMTQWVIYSSPSDYPGKYVLRGHDIVKGSPEPRPRPECAVFATLDEARSAVPPVADYCLPRHPTDPLAIVEVWI